MEYFTIEQAERMGAFEETALDPADALKAGAMLPADAEGPAFLGNDVAMEPTFSHFRTQSAREMFRLQPGESIFGAAERRAALQALSCEALSEPPQS